MWKQEYKTAALDSLIALKVSGDYTWRSNCFHIIPWLLKTSRHDSSIDPQAYYMSTAEFVNTFRAYHALLSIIDTAFKKLRVRQTRETDSLHPIEVAVQISFCRIYLLSNLRTPVLGLNRRPRLPSGTRFICALEAGEADSAFTEAAGRADVCKHLERL